MGWIHNDVRVGLEKGGGTREMKASVDCTYQELIDAGKRWFFPVGKSSFGTMENMTFGLADFKRQLLEKHHDDDEFTLGAYAQKNGFKSRVRIYMTTNSRDEDIASLSSDDDALPIPWEQLNPSTSETSEPVIDSSLKGTSQGQMLLKDQQDKAFCESLVEFHARNEGKVRANLLETEVENITRQETLRSTRASRVPVEPNVEDDHVVVLVRHVTLGVVSRMFLKNTTTMTQVYDWIGSLQLVPEYFKLVSPISGDILLPENQVTEAAKCVLNMCETEDPISLVHDDNEVDALGFAETVLQEEISEHFPENFMEGDEDNRIAEKVSVLNHKFSVEIIIDSSSQFTGTRKWRQVKSTS